MRTKSDRISTILKFFIVLEENAKVHRRKKNMERPLLKSHCKGSVFRC